MAHKIKVFLSGVVNSTNAQNLNCRALMRHLDPTKFEVRALTVYSGNLGLPEVGCAAKPVDGHGSRLASLFYSTPKSFYPVRYPARIWHVIQLLRGILWSDVSFLCKPEHWKLQRFVCGLFSKRSFSAVESIYIGIAKDRAVARFGGEEMLRQFHAMTTQSFAITKGMIAMNRESVNLPDPDGILYLGTDYDVFADETQKTKLTDVLLVGADLKRKGIDDYLTLAERFPQLTFHVAGGAIGEIDYAAQCEAAGLKNVVFHGSLSHAQLAELLKGIQLHVFPSRAEGFPKVTLETAAAGVPSVVYDDYGADEWITHGKNGYVVKTVEEMAACIRELLDHPEKLQSMADDARAMAKSFDWKVRVKDWERVIDELALG